ncbi:MAG: hypothetical protein KKA60_00640 [Proteobacteria bacterium]|nr:hypothetical protein [Pseudomonadota bacterium]
MTEASRQALEILRSPGLFQWNILFGLGLVIYVYINELSRRNFEAVLLGLIFSTVELAWEMVNGLVLHFSGYAALWTTPGDTSYLILVGLNLEIFLLFLLAGVAMTRLLQGFRAEPEVRVAGMPPWFFAPLFLGLFCVAVECALNRLGVLVWTWRFWNWPHIWVIVINYLTPFFLVTWGYYRLSQRAKGIILGVFLALDFAMWAVFVNILSWI